MKRKPLIILASVIGVVILLLAVLPLLFNADSFRPAVQTQLTSSLGRRVEIGKLRLSILAGGIKADEITIADDPHFSNTPFLHAKSIEVGVELMPLIFSRTLHITGVTLDEPDVTLLHSASGKWNFSSLGAASESASANATPSNISIAKLEVVKGRVTLGRDSSLASRGKTSTYEDVNLVAKNVGYGSAIPFTFDAKTPGGGKVKIEGTAGPIDRVDVAVSPLDAKISIDHMDLASTGFLDPASGIAGILDYTGTVHSDGKIARSQGKATVNKLRLVRAGTPAKQPVALDYSSDFNVARQSGTLTKGAIQTGKSTVQLAGDYDMHGTSTLVHMKLNGSRLPVQDIQGLLPAMGVILPSGASLQGGSVDAKLALDGAVDRLVTTGTLNMTDAKLAGFNLASKMSALSALAGLRGSSDTLIQTLSSNLRIAPEGIRADNLNILVPAIGSITGAGTIDANHALNFRMAARLANGGGVLGQISVLNPLRQSNSTLPFLIQGTTSNPIFIPDVAGVMKQNIASPQSSPVGGLLQGIFGQKKKP